MIRSGACAEKQECEQTLWKDELDVYRFFSYNLSEHEFALEVV